VTTGFSIHDPTTKNRQGNDVGTSYRSAAFYRDDAQKAIIEILLSVIKLFFQGYRRDHGILEATDLIDLINHVFDESNERGKNERT
jgi:peptide methionine sulfoxide reductase MsrA